MRYHLDNLRIQCFRCNIDLSGNGAIFYHKLVALEGKGYVNKLFALKKKTVKLNITWLQEKIKEYERIKGLESSRPSTESIRDIRSALSF